jgi:hypothetical protein
MEANAPYGMGTAGVVMSIISLAVSILIIIVVIIVAASSASVYGALYA